MTTCFDMDPSKFYSIPHFVFQKNTVYYQKNKIKNKTISGCIISEKCHRSLAYFQLKKTFYDMDNYLIQIQSVGQSTCRYTIYTDLYLLK